MNLDTTLGIALIAIAAAILISAAVVIAIGYCARLGAEVERMDNNDRDGIDFDNLRRRIGDPVIPQPRPEKRR